MKINSIKKGRVVILLPSILFFTFICLIIFMADTDHDSWILKIPKIIPYGDKLGHFLLYGIMAFLLNTTLNYRRIKVLKVSFRLGALIVLGFAIAEEFTQLAFSSRTFDFVDILFDVIGISCFSFVQKASKAAQNQRIHTRKNTN